MNELALFAGAGGGILGSRMLGWRTVCAVEYEQYAASVLAARQNDGSLEAFPIWSDVSTFDGKPWNGIIDVVSGGFPCQDISSTGRGAGIDGERSGLWSEMARIIDEVRPRFVWVENSPELIRRGLARVLGNLSSMGYDAKWGVVGAYHAGAIHKRERMWILAYSPEIRSNWNGKEKIYREQGKQTWEGYRGIEDIIERPPIHSPRFCRVDDGVAYRVDRVGAIGNGQVPQAMTLAFEELSKGIIYE